MLAPLSPKRSRRALALATVGICIAGAACGGSERIPAVVRVEGRPAHFVGVGSRGSKTCAVTESGHVGCFAWGDAAANVLRDGNPPKFEWVADVRGVVSVAMGGAFACALHDGGRISCWGENQHGQLGGGTTVGQTTAQSVTGIDGAQRVVAGYAFACAALRDGRVACWGENAAAQLGDGTTKDSASPVFVDGIADAIDVAVGNHHACALRRTGSVSCWGKNQGGQLGDGSQTDSREPVPVREVGGARALVAGSEHTCALMTAGVTCWGHNQSGQRGIGETAWQEAPTRVKFPASIGEADVRAVVATDTRTCALTESGNVACWGKDYTLFGGLDWQEEDRLATTPRTVTRLFGARHVSVGDGYTCGVVGRDLVCEGVFDSYYY